ncbi:MAG: hypothetical protein DRP83_01935 [Planctomycetota bacterium]|nr:MAG: hypothetical protein DRP83_01935 [Planctomycetota bacterium]
MELNEVCSRCGKSVKVPADPQLMTQKIEEETAIKAVIAKVEQFANDLQDPLPEIITLVRFQDDDGEYRFEVKALGKLCGPDVEKKRNKSGCLNRVKALVGDIHRVPRGKKKDE